MIIAPWSSLEDLMAGDTLMGIYTAIIIITGFILVWYVVLKSVNDRITDHDIMMAEM